MGRRAEISNSVRINRPAEQVFDYLIDVSKHPEWSPKPFRVEGVTGPVAVGTVFTSYGLLPGSKKEHKNEVTVTAVDRPAKFTFAATEQGETFVNTFTLTPDGDGTTVERHVDAPVPPGFLGVMFPLIASMVIKPGIGKGLQQLKAKVEAS